MQKTRGAAGIGCAVVAIALVAATGAAGGYKKGHYQGTTEQACGPPTAAEPCAIRFKATRLLVKKLSFAANVACDDGSVFMLSTDIPAKAPVNQRGKFRALFLPAPGGDVSITTEVKGKLKRKRAKGTITSSGSNASGASCSAEVEWTARRAVS